MVLIWIQVIITAAFNILLGWMIHYRSEKGWKTHDTWFALIIGIGCAFIWFIIGVEIK
jgi:hypothetical protein